MMIFGIPHEFVISDAKDLIRNSANNFSCKLGQHEMFNWTPAIAWHPGTNPCRYIRNCRHCADVVEECFKHSWIEWEQVPEKPGLQVRKCALCNEIEMKEDHMSICDNRGVINHGNDNLGLALWAETKKNLQRAISTANFDNWIEPIQFSHIDGQTLHLVVPNQFFKEWLEDSYADLINSAASMVFGKELLLSISCK